MSDIHVDKKKSESFEAMYRRFTRRIQQSGKVFNVRKARFRVKKNSKNKQKDKKLRSMKIGADIQYKLLTGKIKEEDLRGRRRRRR